MRIRQATPSDLACVVFIEQTCFPPAEAASKERLLERLTTFPAHFLLAEQDDGTPIGFINGFCTNEPHLSDLMYADASLHDPKGDWQMVFGLDVLPSHQHLGHGSLLMRHFIELARRQGRKGCVLTCKPEKIGFYERFGYADEGVSPSQHGGTLWHEMRLTF